MKVVLAVTTFFPDTVGGMEIYVEGLAKEIEKRGYNVKIASPSSNSKYEKKYVHEGVKVYRYPRGENIEGKVYRGQKSTPSSESFHLWIERENPDVFHVNGLTAGLHLPEIKAAHRNGAKVVLTSHLPNLVMTCLRGTLMRWGEELCDGITKPTKCTECMLQSKGVPKMIAKIFGMLPYTSKYKNLFTGNMNSALEMKNTIKDNIETRKKIFDVADKCVVLNESCKNILLRNGINEEKIELNRSGLMNNQLMGIKEKEKRETEKPVKVGFLGRITSVKGVHDLARAVSRLSKDIPIDCEFRGPASEEILSELKNIVGSDSRVSFEPPVPSEQVPSVLSGYDVLCCPSRWFEVGPLVMFEAHAVGTPVIGSNVGGMSEVIEDNVNGMTIPIGGVDELKSTLVRICKNPGIIDRWGKNIPEPRTINDISEEYIRIYKN